VNIRNLRKKFIIRKSFLFFSIVFGIGGKKVGIAMGLKLYHISDSPSCISVRMALAYLGLEVELIDIDFLKAEQVSEVYRKVYMFVSIFLN
jgi:hypothetical protein